MDRKCELIVTIVNRGWADLVMEAAKGGGASGGTVLHARGTGAGEAARFFGVPITPEKEVVLILVESERRSAIMRAVCETAGLASEGHGLSFSLPVDGVVGVPRFEALYPRE